MPEGQASRFRQAAAALGRIASAPPRALWRHRAALILRVYALAILLVVVWTGYTAVAYLMRSVFTPARVPPRLLEWEARLDVSALRPEPATGVTRHAPRPPLGHYHGVDRWFPPDPGNDCTTSGCHGPLPHLRSKELRAMANFHVTFLDCMMCHHRSGEPGSPVWVNSMTGALQEAPALLRLATLLDSSERQAAGTAALHAQILGLLRESIDAASPELFLEDIRVRMDTSEPGSPVWRQALERLGEQLPSQMRGEYDARLTPATLAQSGAADLRRARRAAALPLESAERSTLLQEIHAPVLPQPGACASCHNLETPRLDFEALGYTPLRAAQLRSSPVARMMQQIQEGRPFHLPGLLERTDDR